MTEAHICPRNDIFYGKKTRNHIFVPEMISIRKKPRNLIFEFNEPEMDIFYRKKTEMSYLSFLSQTPLKVIFQLFVD